MRTAVTAPPPAPVTPGSPAASAPAAAATTATTANGPRAAAFQCLRTSEAISDLRVGIAAAALVFATPAAASVDGISPVGGRSRDPAGGKVPAQATGRSCDQATGARLRPGERSASVASSS